MKVLGTYIEREMWRHSSVFKGLNALVMGERKEDVITRHLERMFVKFGFRTLSCVSCEQPQLDLFSAPDPIEYSRYDGSSWVTEKVGSSGSFDSEFTQSILPNYDIVFGIPDYNEMGMYINSLDRMGKKFILLGHICSVFDKGVFSLFRSGRVHLGFTLRGGHLKVVEDYESEFSEWNRRRKLINGDSVQLQNYRWFCNTGVRKYNLPYSNHYKEASKELGKFDNVDALNVPNFRNIPPDYHGEVGTTPLILDIMRDDEFQLLYNHTDIRGGVWYKGKQTSYRVFVRRNSKE